VAGAAVAGGAVAATQIAGKVAGPDEYTGSFSGTITGSLTSAINVCNYTKSVTATATLHFDEGEGRGEFEYEGTETVTSSTCIGGTPTSPQFIGQVDLTGSASSFSGRNTFAGPPTANQFGGTITGAHVYTFQGSISGDSASGVFTYEENSLSTGSGGGVTQLGTGNFSISFRKQ